MTNRPPAHRPKTPAIAIVALILTFICFPLGLILGIIALVQIGNSNGELGGRGIALAAIIMSALAVPMMGIMAAIAIPNFVRYQLRAKAVEAKSTLRSIRNAQEMARQRYKRYLKAEPSLAAPGPAAQYWASAPCSPDCAYDQPSKCTSFDCLEFNPGAEVHFSYACETSADGAHFTCAALGDLDGDGIRSLFVYGTGDSEIVAPIPDFDGASPACRPRPNEVTKCTPNVY